MAHDSFVLRQALVFASAAFYWTGVLIKAFRLRRVIGRFPNILPRGPKERLLWAGWSLVILGWLGQPLLLRPGRSSSLFFLWSEFLFPLALPLGILLLIVGHLGTLWCYEALGEMWRMGIRRREKTSLVQEGPYRWVRHPLYLFQGVLLLGAAVLLPTPCSLILLVVHVICAGVKANDEEAYLTGVHGADYRRYVERTGRFLPRLGRRVARRLRP